MSGFANFDDLGLKQKNLQISDLQVLYFFKDIVYLLSKYFKKIWWAMRDSNCML